MKILVTGSAGFIGFHLVLKLLQNNYNVVGIDNINNYYDPELKYARLKECGIYKTHVEWNHEATSKVFSNYRFIRINIVDKDQLAALCLKEQFDIIVHLAAQAGVRYSIINPDAYAQSNLTGFLNVLEMCRNNVVKHLIFASSSSVYGLNTKMPFSESDFTDQPVSLYGATKKANELMAHAYAHLYKIPITGLRFFTVYGPWGRPDMAYFLFAESILKGKPIQVFNYGKMKRDFTYIDDVIEGITSIIHKQCESPDNEKNAAPLFKVYNIGNNKPIKLTDFIKKIETNLGQKAILEFKDIQDGDVIATWANIDNASLTYNYKPKTTIEIGINQFIKWYKDFYKIGKD